MAIVRRLNEIGLGEFSRYIERTAAGEKASPPFELLDSPETSESLQVRSEVERLPFPTKQAAAEYLSRQLSGLDRAEVDHHPGLWGWLSLFYFDQVCPAKADGTRAPGEAVRYILSQHAHRYYRHLLAGPYRLLALHGINARIFLCSPLPTHGDFSEQLASRMEFITNRSLIEAVDRLYFQPDGNGGGSIKRGAATRTRAGNIRRLVAVVQQLDLTYDLYAMTSSDILDLLPVEFQRWHAAPM